MMTETTAAPIFGYYALARRGTRQYGIIWAEIKPTRADYWTGEVVATQKAAEEIVSERNLANLFDQRPPGQLERVRPIDAMGA